MGSKVRTKIAQYWPDIDPQEIVDILDQYGTEPFEQGRARVHLAILKLSEGDKQRLAELVAMAKRDFRDVVAYAEYPEEARLGFVAMKQLSQEEAQSVRSRDREQYTRWLEGRPPRKTQPKHKPVDDLELEQAGAEFISRFFASGEGERSALKVKGADLAHQLRRKAIDLAQSRATEFSPKIRLYHQLAAKVALLAHWPDSKALEVFEKDIRYYRHFERTQPLVDEYERFRAAYTGSESSS